MGRPTKYNKKIVEKICSLIATDTYTVAEVCRMVKIDRSTYFDWVNRFPDFSDAIKKAEAERMVFFVAEAKKSLLRKIQGYTVQEKHITTVGSGKYDINGKEIPRIKEQKIVDKHYQPDTAAIIFALTNLDPEHWKNRQQLDGNIQSDVRFTGFRSVLPNVPDIEAITNNVRERSREKFLNEDNDYE